MGPFASIVATRLICVACFDREVGVRRAASAAFQEGVGRLVRQIFGPVKAANVAQGVYPEGIDVLGHTDFYSVSIRRFAFSIAAPFVAK